MKLLWTLRELVDIVQQVFVKSSDYHGSSKRVKWTPDRRLARYYASIGLFDKPVEIRGRTGLYGMRHLLQLVTVKKLQVEGLNLEAIKQILQDQSEESLRYLADLPDDWTPPQPRRIKRRDSRQMSLFDPEIRPEPAATGFTPIPGVTLLIDHRILKTIDDSQIHDALEALEHCLSQ